MLLTSDHLRSYRSARKILRDRCKIFFSRIVVQKALREVNPEGILDRPRRHKLRRMYVSDLFLAFRRKTSNKKKAIELLWQCNMLRIAIKYLVDAKKKRKSLLQRACILGWIDIFTLLITDYYCDPRYHIDDNGNTVLHTSCQYGRINLVRCLVSKRWCMDPLMKNKSGVTALDYSKEHGHIDVTNDLENILALFVSFRQKTQNKSKAIELIHTCNNSGIQLNGLVDTEEHHYKSLLQWAGIRGWRDVCKKLIVFKCDPLYEDINNWTVLHNVCRNGYIDLVRYFMSKPFQIKPLIHWKNNDGHTPLDLSKKHGYTDITEYLENIKTSADEVVEPDPEEDGTILAINASAQVEADPDVDEIILKDTEINLIQIMVETDTITDWSILAILLGISKAVKIRIMKNNAGDALGQNEAFVKVWLENGEASWAILVSALRHQLVKQKACANEIAKNHPRKSKPSQEDLAQGSSSSILNKVPSLTDAFKCLNKKSADWDAIGRALDSVSGNDTSDKRKGLHKDSSLENSARLEAFLNIWLQQGGASSTWGQLKEALKEDYLDVVNKIEEFLELPLSKK